MENDRMKEKIKMNLQEDIGIHNFLTDDMMNRNRYHPKKDLSAIQKSVITFMTLLFGTGVVFATGYNIYERIFKEPIQRTRQEIVDEKTEITEKNKEEINISEVEAKEIALLKLQELEYSNVEFKTIELKKFIEDGDTIYYRAKTDEKEETGIEILVNATTKKAEIFTDWDLKKANYVADNINEENAIKLAKQTLSKLEVDLKDYEIGDVTEHKSNFGDNIRKNWYVSFYKSYDGLVDEKESASVFFFVTNGEIKINDFNIMHDNVFEENDVVLSEQRARKIAEDKEKEFSSLEIKNIVTELEIENINSRIYELENNIEMYELLETDKSIALTRKENQHYETENIRRKVWKVTIEHEPLDNIKKDVTSITDYIRKYCNKDYYIDATTGEIVGGNDNLVAGNYSKEMLRRSWGMMNMKEY